MRDGQVVGDASRVARYSDLLSLANLPLACGILLIKCFRNPIGLMLDRRQNIEAG